MHSTKDRYLLMIEPANPPSEFALRDEITEMFRPIFEAALSNRPDWMDCYKGFHECSCGVMSETFDIRLPSGHLTNSLAMHYLEFHRDEVPASEIAKIRALCHATPAEIAERVRLNENGYESGDHELPRQPLQRPKPVEPALRPLSNISSASRRKLERWCLADVCACAGCANNFFRKQAEWQKWVASSGGKLIDATHADITNVVIPGTVRVYSENEAGMVPVKTLLKFRDTFQVDIATARQICQKGKVFLVADPEQFVADLEAKGIRAGIETRVLPNYRPDGRVS